MGWVVGLRSASRARSVKLRGIITLSMGKPLAIASHSDRHTQAQKSAKLSFSQVSFHHYIVTRSPNHMWDSSCTVTLLCKRRESSVTLAWSIRHLSVNVIIPTFSIPRILNSGTYIWSYFAYGNGVENKSWKNLMPSVTSLNYSLASRFANLLLRQNIRMGTIGSSPAL